MKWYSLAMAILFGIIYVVDDSKDPDKYTITHFIISTAWIIIFQIWVAVDIIIKKIEESK